MNARWVAVGGLIGLLEGCGAPPAPAPPRAPAPVASTPAPAVPVAMPKEPEVKPLPPLAYNAKGRRDPFAALGTTEAPKGLTAASVKLVGILEGRRERLALVETPEGLGYIVRSGDLVGDGRVVEIGRDSLTLSVSPKPGTPATSLVLRLSRD